MAILFKESNVMEEPAVVGPPTRIAHVQVRGHHHWINLNQTQLKFDKWYEQDRIDRPLHHDIMVALDFLEAGVPVRFIWLEPFPPLPNCRYKVNKWLFHFGVRGRNPNAD